MEGAEATSEAAARLQLAHLEEPAPAGGAAVRRHTKAALAETLPHRLLIAQAAQGSAGLGEAAHVGGGQPRRHCNYKLVG